MLANTRQYYFYFVVVFFLFCVYKLNIRLMFGCAFYMFWFTSYKLMCVPLWQRAWWYYTKADINCNWYFSFFLQHFFFSFCVLFGSGLLLLWPLRGCCLYFCVFLFSFCLLFLMLKRFILITFYDADLLLLLFSFCIVVNMQQLILLPRYMYVILSVSFFVHQHHIIVIIIVVVAFSVSIRI